MSLRWNNLSFNNLNGVDVDAEQVFAGVNADEDVVQVVEEEVKCQHLGLGAQRPVILEM